MAKKKISELPQATTLGGSELIPMVQGGTTKQGTVDQLVTLLTPLLPEGPVGPEGPMGPDLSGALALLASTDPGEGAEMVGFIQDGTGATDRTSADKSRERVTPYDFGAVGNGVTDDTAAVQAFFDYCGSVSVPHAIIQGVFKTTAKITLSGNATRAYQCGFELKPTYTDLTGAAFDILVGAVVFNGRIQITGNASAWASRTIADGLNIAPATGHLHFDVIQCVNFRRWGIYCQDGGGGIGISGSTFNQLYGVRCGTGDPNTANYQTTVNVTARADSGSSGSTGQSTLLTVDSIPDHITANEAWLIIDDDLVLIESIDTGANTITVYPWPDLTFASGVVQVIAGGAVSIKGNDSNCVNIGQLSALSCGTGYRAAQLYPANVGYCTTQNCGIGHSLGQSHTGAALAGIVHNLYGENNVVDFMKTTSAAAHYRIGNSLGTEAGLAKVRTPGLRTSGNVRTETGSFGFEYRGVGRTLPSRMSQTGTTKDIGADVAPMGMQTYNRDSGTVTLLARGGDLSRMFKMHDFFVFWRGTGSNNQPTGTCTFAPESGYSINGGAVDASVDFSGFTGPVTFHCHLTDTAWTVTPLNSERVLIGSKTHDWADLATATTQSTTVTVTGAALGDHVTVSMSVALGGTRIWGEVTASDTVTVYQSNNTGGNVNVASGTLRARVRKA